MENAGGGGGLRRAATSSFAVPSCPPPPPWGRKMAEGVESCPTLALGALGLYYVSQGIATMDSPSYLGSSHIWYYGPDPLTRGVR